jgi:hypothetical protein
MLKPRFVRVRDYAVPKRSPKWDWYHSHTLIVRVGQVFKCPHCGQLYTFGIRSTPFGAEPELYSTHDIACVHIEEFPQWAGKEKNRHVRVHFYDEYEVPHPLAVVPDDELHPESEFYDLTDEDDRLDFEEAAGLDLTWLNLPE